jgi:hypothetical protein
MSKINDLREEYMEVANDLLDEADGKWDWVLKNKKPIAVGAGGMFALITVLMAVASFF